MLRQQLSQKLQQKLSPQQIQVIKLLEIPTIELEERIRQELEENPALEEGVEEPLQKDEDDFDAENETGDDDFDLEEYMMDDDIPDYKLQANNISKDDKQNDIPFSEALSLQEFLNEQLLLQKVSEEDMLLAKYVIGNIDEEGYLRRSIDAIVDDLAFQVGLTVSDLHMSEILQLVQEFEPAGIGARNLQECLALQIGRKEKSESTKLAREIITNFFEDFSKKHYEKIIRRLNISEELFKKANAEIIKLNPKPGSGWGNLLEKTMEQVIPDFLLEVENGRPYVVLNNRNVPELKISQGYQDMFQDYVSNKNNRSREMKEAVTFVKQKLDSAKWFIDAIKQRHHTLLTTMNAIVSFQKEFFLRGDETFLRPMILKDIAEITGFDISTISRVSNSKYIQTEFGIFPVKYFFSESMQTDSGEEVSTREIKSILQECIENEDKRKPVTDDKLCEILNEKGYQIARRTVAKYREQIGIPVARLRKEL